VVARGAAPRRRPSDRTPLVSAADAEPPTVGSRIGEILVAQAFITREELGAALLSAKQQRSKKLGEILIEMGYTSHKMIGIALAVQYNLPFVSLSGYSLDASLQDLVRKEEAVHWQMIPLTLERSVLTIAIADPGRTDFREQLERRSGALVAKVVATPQDILRAIEGLYCA
jgi:type IV pilus assembly protein PilB